MIRLRVWIAKLSGLLGQDRRDRDLQEEIAAHVEEATEEYLRQGLSYEDARRAALRSFGGVAQVQEVHRELRTFVWLEDARRDMRYALRTLLRTPVVSSVAIVTLALKPCATLVTQVNRGSSGWLLLFGSVSWRLLASDDRFTGVTSGR